MSDYGVEIYAEFQHTATRRWLPQPIKGIAIFDGFNTQPPEGGCPLLTVHYLVF